MSDDDRSPLGDGDARTAKRRGASAPGKRSTSHVHRSRRSITNGTAEPLTVDEEALWMQEALKPLNAREERFVAEYLKELNQTEAYMRAFNTAHRATARSQASLMMSRPNVQVAIEQARRRDVEIAGLDRVRILRELTAVALVDIRQAFNDDGTLKNPSEWDDATAAAVGSLEVTELTDSMSGAVVGHLKKLKLWPKMDALDKAMRHLGLFELDNKQVGEASQVSREDLDAIYANGAQRMLDMAVKVQGRSARLDAQETASDASTPRGS
jgi:phage terminase small subunit